MAQALQSIWPSAYSGQAALEPGHGLKSDADRLVLQTPGRIAHGWFTLIQLLQEHLMPFVERLFSLTVQHLVRFKPKHRREI